MDILFLSNCYGEDRSAALIARELKKLRPALSMAGAPLISRGEEYTKRGIPVITKGRTPPSGGFPTRSVRGFFLDIPTAYIPLKYYLILRGMREEINHAMVVGDVPLLILSHLSLRKKFIFLAPAKSDYQRPHYRIEEYLMRKLCRKVLTHDEYTADNLRKRRIPALFLGNPMMDNLTPEGLNLGSSPLIGILPGSRSEAYRNFIRILKVVERIRERAGFAAAIPSSLSIDTISLLVKKENWILEEGKLKKNGKHIILVQDGFEDVITKSDIIIGLAGTANEQAAGKGKPVISFPGYGAQTTPGRMKDQERLLGGAVKFIADFPEGVVKEISYLLTHPEERERRGKIGVSRMGPAGGAQRIAKLLIEEFNLQA